MPTNGLPGRRSRAVKTVLVATIATVAASTMPSGATAAPPDRDTYVVQTQAGQVDAVADEVVKGGDKVKHRYRRVLRGFSATMPPGRAEALKRHPHVKSVTPDEPTSVGVTQSSPPWGLDRVDQRPADGNGTYSYDSTGAGVTAFVIDTGIRFTHSELTGRAVSGYDFVDLDSDASDCGGHGTHVSGTVGGRSYGVAKATRFVSLRVWGCNNSGWFSDMIAALDWAVQHKPSGPSVVNISGGGGGYPPMDDAVDAATAAGIPVVVAAMNNNGDACSGSPARAPGAITVAASDDADRRASWSNYGSCVDIWAPGVDVLSAVNSSDTAAEYWSGTSMATPHVTGAAARYLELHPSAGPAAVARDLAAEATPHAVTDSLSPNDGLLYIAPPVVQNANLVVNPSFESGTAGWGSIGGTLTREALFGAPDGASVVRAGWTSGGTYSLNDSLSGGRPTVASTTAGTTYVATGFIRAANAASVGKPVDFVLREMTPAGATVKSTVISRSLGSTFARIGVAATAAATGNTMSLRVVQLSAVSGNAFYADLMTVRVAAQVMGVSQSTLIWGTMDVNAKRVSRFAFATPATVDLSALQAYVDGRQATTGTQAIRGVIYADSGGAPGALLARTSDFVINAGRAPGWVTLSFASPVRVAAGSYWLGVQTGGPSVVGRYAYSIKSNAFRRNADSFADGPSNPFGTATVADRRIWMSAVGG